MKIENRENINGNIRTTVLFKNERYSRVEKHIYHVLTEKSIVQWKKCKTNHLVNAEKHKQLEELFKTVDTTTKEVVDYTKSNSGAANLPASGTTMIYNFKPAGNSEKKYKSAAEKLVDNTIIGLCIAGKKLEAVKIYKEQVGLGLKEAKDYVDSLYAEHLAGQKWNKAMIPTRKLIANEFDHNSRESEAHKKILSSFHGRQVSMEQLISKVKDYFAVGKSSLETIIFIKRETGWELYVSKFFFDNYIKK